METTKMSTKLNKSPEEEFGMTTEELEDQKKIAEEIYGKPLTVKLQEAIDLKPMDLLGK